MQRYFLEENEYEKREIIGDNYHHIAHVMRMKEKDSIIVIYHKKTYLAKLFNFKASSVSFDIVNDLKEQTEFAFVVDIIQGYAKGEKMDFIVKKTTELGVTGIYPSIMERSIVKIEEGKMKSRTERFKKIAKEAAEQSGRIIIPEIYEIKRLKEIDFSKYDIRILAYENCARNYKSDSLKMIIDKINDKSKVLFAIGPEGGISNDEVDFFIKNEFHFVSLGPRILRTETASLFFLSALSYAKEVK